MDVSMDHFNIIRMNELHCFTTTTQNHTVIKQRYGTIFTQARGKVTTPLNIKAALFATGTSVKSSIIPD
jgi:hypothetical protein